MKTLSTILISALIFSSTALASIPKSSEVKSTKQIKQYSLFPDKYESLWQVQDEDIPKRRIRLTEEDRLPITYPTGTIDLFR